MGYYVSIDSSTFVLEAKYYDEAYKAMCALNLFDTIKRGGSYNKDKLSGVVTENKWFSWMSPNYPETLTTANVIMVQSLVVMIVRLVKRIYFLRLVVLGLRGRFIGEEKMVIGGWITMIV